MKGNRNNLKSKRKPSKRGTTKGSATAEANFMSLLDFVVETIPANGKLAMTTSHKNLTIGIEFHLLTTGVANRNPRFHHFDLSFSEQGDPLPLLLNLGLLTGFKWKTLNPRRACWSLWEDGAGIFVMVKGGEEWWLEGCGGWGVGFILLESCWER